MFPSKQIWIRSAEKALAERDCQGYHMAVKVIEEMEFRRTAPNRMRPLTELIQSSSTATTLR
jgi:hypothetical protein